MDLDAVQSLLAMSQWSPPTPERNIPSPDSGMSSMSRNSSSASLSSTCTTSSTMSSDESSSGSDFGYKNQKVCQIKCS